jgi:hypothetical protein
VIKVENQLEKYDSFEQPDMLLYLLSDDVLSRNVTSTRVEIILMQYNSVLGSGP